MCRWTSEIIQYIRFEMYMDRPDKHNLFLNYINFNYPSFLLLYVIICLRDLKTKICLLSAPVIQLLLTFKKVKKNLLWIHDMFIAVVQLCNFLFLSVFSLLSCRPWHFLVTRGCSQTTLTKFCPFLPTYLPMHS